MTGQAKGDAELIRQIYGCALEDEHWPALLARVTRAFGATYSVVMTQDRQTGLAAIGSTDVLSEERQRAYETHYGPRTPTLQYCHALPVGGVFTDEMYDDPGSYLRSEIYNDYFEPLDAHHLMFLQTRHDRREDKCVVLRRSRRLGPFERRQLRRFRRLGQHFCAAECVASQLQATDLQSRNLRGLLDRLGVAAFVTTDSGRILYMSRQAEEMVREGAVLGAVHGRLQAQRGIEPRLRAAIRDCARSLDAPSASPWSVLRAAEAGETGPGPCTIFVSALPWRGELGMARAAALVVANRPGEGWRHYAGVFAEIFDLTPAESRVAAALCDGQTPAAYAAASGVSVLTARTLLKRVQEKTETHSQAALVGLLLGSTMNRAGPGRRTD